MNKNAKKSILIIDAQGGGIGRQLISELKKAYPETELIAAGTNSQATAAMLKAGADHGATGENAIAVCAQRADIIAGPIGIVIADSLYGEISPSMAKAVGQSRAVRVLIPMNHCDNIVVGVSDLNVGRLVQEAVLRIGQELEK